MFNSSAFRAVLLLTCALLLSLQRSFGFDDKQNLLSSINSQTLLNKGSAGFVENKGQIVDQNNVPNTAVRFLLNFGGLNVQLRGNGFSYDSYQDYPDGGKSPKKEAILSATSLLLNKRKSTDAPMPTVRKYHRVDVELVGANSAPQIEPLKPQQATRNYYTQSGEFNGVRSFEQVVYRGIYPNIDLEFFLTNRGEPEYQFIVHPGGNPDDIRLRYTGANSTRLVNGSVELAVAHGIVKEHIPLSYLVGSNKEIKVLFSQIGINEFKCNVPSYSSSETLIIDPAPVLNWGTYYGGTSAESGNGIACDANRNVYVTGFSWSDDIATAGAYQSTNAGNQDAFIVKFSALGVRQWGTFYGGANYETGSGIACDPSGNVFVIGSTMSTTDIATASSHQNTFGGGPADAFLVKFSASGARQWATYYGGAADEYGLAVACDPSGNVFITGSTESPASIASAGAQQTTFGGFRDAFLAKFSGSGVRQWGTYYGGTDEEDGNGVACDPSGNVFIVGFTNSSNAIASTGAHQTISTNGYDAFLAKFSGSGVRQWGTFYGGIGFDVGYGVACAASGNVFITGLTASPNAIATDGAYKTINDNNNYDAFLAGFSGSGVRQWGTYYGGSENDQGFGVACNATGNVFVTGSTASATGIASAGAHQILPGSDEDAFLVKFSGSGIRQWGTYYGGNNYDDGLGVACDPNGNVCVTGYTWSPNAIATNGAHDVVLSGSQDAFITSFSETDFLSSSVVWLQGASITGLADGQTLQTWNDDAGGDDNASQTTANYRPTYRSNGLWTMNGNPSLQFGAGKGLGMTARSELNGGGDKTIFAVFKTGSNTLNRQVLVDIGGVSNGFNLYIANNNLYAGAWDNQNTWLSRQVSANTVYLAQFVYNGAMLKLSANAAPNGTGSATYVDFNDNFVAGSPQGNGIGAAWQQARYHNGTYVGAALSDPFLGAIAEVIIMNSSNLAERTQAWDYLNQKYAIGMSEQPIAKYAVAEQSNIDPASEDELTVYPNPSTDETVISYFMPVESPVRLQIQNVLGETVMLLEEGMRKEGAHQSVLYSGDLPSGIYRAVLVTPTGSISTQVIIQH